MTLDEWIKQEALTDAEFGAKIGRDRTTVSRIRREKTCPDPATMQAIVDATGGAVEPNDFFDIPAQPAEPAIS